MKKTPVQYLRITISDDRSRSFHLVLKCHENNRNFSLWTNRMHVSYCLFSLEVPQTLHFHYWSRHRQETLKDAKSRSTYNAPWQTLQVNMKILLATLISLTLCAVGMVPPTGVNLDVIQWISGHFQSYVAYAFRWSRYKSVIPCISN